MEKWIDKRRIDLSFVCVCVRVCVRGTINSLQSSELMARMTISPGTLACYRRCRRWLNESSSYSGIIQRSKVNEMPKEK